MISLESKHTQIIPLINIMLEKSPFKSTQLLLDQVEDHLQRCCQNLLHIIPRVLLTNERLVYLKVRNVKVFRILLKVQKRRYEDCEEFVNAIFEH